MTDLATAYYLAAQWHDKQAAACRGIAKDEPRLAKDVRDRAASPAHAPRRIGSRAAASGDADGAGGHCPLTPTTHATNVRGHHIEEKR